MPKRRRIWQRRPRCEYSKKHLFATAVLALEFISTTYYRTSINSYLHQNPGARCINLPQDAAPHRVLQRAVIVLFGCDPQERLLGECRPDRVIGWNIFGIIAKQGPMHLV